MSYLKKRLAVFLCVLVAFTAVFCVTPQESVEAASSSVSISTSFTGTVEIEKGASNFYVGDYFWSYNGGQIYLSNCSGVTYSSSDTSVVSVSKAGKVTAKKKGTATVTVKYKGLKVKMKIKVVSSLKSYRSSYYSEAKSAATTFIKSYGGKDITTDNRYSVLTNYRIYTQSGYNRGSWGYSSYYENNAWVHRVYLPDAVRAYVLSQKVVTYASSRNPFSTSSSKFTVSSISGKNKTITAKLSSNVTANQIFGAQYVYAYDTKVTSVKTVDFPIYVVDTKTNYRYYATATITQGSKTMTITTKNLKLKSGSTYQLKDYNGQQWLSTGKVSFKAK